MKRTKRWFVTILIMIVLVSCGPARHEPGLISKMPAKITSPPPLVVPSSVFRADPTLGKVKNDTRNVFIKIWIDPKVKSVDIRRYDQLSAILGVPTLTLIPGLSRELHMDLGVHLLYAEGMIKTKYGWKSLGFATKDVVVDSSISGGGHYGWYVAFRRGNFQR